MYAHVMLLDAFREMCISHVIIFMYDSCHYNISGGGGGGVTQDVGLWGSKNVGSGTFTLMWDWLFFVEII